MEQIGVGTEEKNQRGLGGAGLLEQRERSVLLAFGVLYKRAEVVDECTGKRE